MKIYKLRQLIKESINEVINEIGVEQLRAQAVDTGKISEEEFQEIVDVSPKSSHTTWLVARYIGNKKAPATIKREDIYKWENYLQTFEKFKHLFPSKDLNAYKTPKDIQILISKSIEIRDQQEDTGEEETGGNNLVTPTQIQNLKEVGINLLGVVDGYQCFKIPMSAMGNESAYKLYKNILGQCSGGAIEICTIASFDTFNTYLQDDDYYIFFNKKDPNSPYQFHYASHQFMDRTDSSII
jgi:hypothetical protein